MFSLRSLALTLAVLVSPGVAAPLQPLKDLSRVAVRSGVEDVQLRAISRSSAKRDQVNNLIPRSSPLNLDYVDETSLADGQPFVATLLFRPFRPAVLLEHIDDLLDDVHCSGLGISLIFASSLHAEAAHNAWIMPEFVVVTSHNGCNNDGERVPYLVSGVAFDNEQNSATLSAKRISWSKASTMLEVDFGHRETHNGLDLDSYRPSASLLAKRDTMQDLSFSVLNTNIFTITDTLSPTASLSFTQKCVACVGTGTMSISTGNITLKSDILGDIGSLFGSSPTIADLASSADLDIIFNNFTAEFAFETSIQVSETFNYHILGADGIGIPGFSIPGLFTLGPSFNPVIVAQIQMFQPVSFTYGFNFSAPSGAGFQLDLVDLTNSQTMGFSGITFTPMPFALANFTPGINVSIAFRPVISLGINVLDVDLDPVTVFADIPKYVVGLVPLADVDDNCAPLPPNGTTGSGEHLRLSSDFVLDLGIGAMVQITDVIAFMPSIPLLTETLFPSSTCLGGFGNGATDMTIAGGGAVTGTNATTS